MREKEQQALQAMQAQQTMQVQAAQQNYKSQIKAEILANKDKYEFLSTIPGTEDLVYSKIEDEFHRTKQLDVYGNVISFHELTIAEACDLIEKEYEESLEPLTKMKKVQSKFKAKEPEKLIEDLKAKTNSTTTSTPKERALTTLTNSHSAETVTKKPLTALERREQLLKHYLNGGEISQG
jgi:hypothetical protein